MQNNQIIIENLNNLIGEKFGNYSKYIIQERALPDLRDGLKPVQRRILYAMSQINLRHNSSYKKSARIVGDVIGKYHPHGDTSVYEAMVRMSQEWKSNLPLVDMHGNKGSIDGDPPAAMRYTEVRLTKAASFMLENIDKKIVNFTHNFDDSEIEPTVLPTLFPNILVNGSVGIASGYSTNIPPHNLYEIIKSLIESLRNDNFTLSDLMKHIQGPDFPTGGYIINREDIPNIYKTGKGKVVIQAKMDYDFKKEQIIVTEIPFELNKSDLVQKLDALVNENKIPGIKYVRDDTDRNGLQITIQLEKNVKFELVKALLFKYSELEKNYHINLIAIKDRKPLLLPLVDVFEGFKEFQISTFRNYYKYLLVKAREKLNILEGLKKATSILDQVLKLIRKSNNKNDAKLNLQNKFHFNEAQAEAIVNLKLYRLTSTDINELILETRLHQKLIKDLELVLKKRDILIERIIEKLELFVKEFQGIKRKTEFLTVKKIDEVKEIDLISETNIYIIVTSQGYIKAIPSKYFENEIFDEEIIRTKNNLVVSDSVIYSKSNSNLNNLYIFLSNGRIYSVPIYRLKEVKVSDIGIHISDIFGISQIEKIIDIFIAKDFNEFSGDLLITTEQGYMKKLDLVEIEPSFSKTGMKYINLQKNDSVIGLETIPTNVPGYIVLITKNGYIFKFDHDDIPNTKILAGGKLIASLIEKDIIVSSIFIADINSKLVILKDDGQAKKIRVDDITEKKDGYKLSITKKRNNINSNIIGAFDPTVETEIKILNDNNEIENINLNNLYLTKIDNSSFTQISNNKVSILLKTINEGKTKKIRTNKKRVRDLFDDPELISLLESN